MDGFERIVEWVHKYEKWCIACFVKVRHLVFMS